MLDLPHHLAFALPLNCCIFCNGCCTLQLAAGKDRLQVARDHRLVAPEQLRQLLKAQPDAFALDAHLDAGFAAFVNHHLVIGFHNPRSLRKASASWMRSAPEISLGSRASRSWARVRDSRSLPAMPAIIGLTCCENLLISS